MKIDKREILFKAIRVNFEHEFQDEWVYGYYRKFKHCMTGPQFTEHTIITETGIRCDVFPETLCQYIGLEDKKRTENFPNGQKIFENDIVDKGYCQGESFVCFVDGIYFTREMEQSDEDFVSNCVNTNEECMTFLCATRTKHMKVIGNRFDNYVDVKKKINENTIID